LACKVLNLSSNKEAVSCEENSHSRVEKEEI
jgi:hypothetical protein